MSTIQLAPSTLAYKFESPGRYGLANYVDSNYDYNLLEFNAYKNQPYHMYPEFKHIQLRKLKNPKRRIMISHIRERLNYDSKVLRAHAVFIDWLIRGANLEKVPASDFIQLLMFKLNGTNIADIIRKNRPGQTAKVAADTLRKVSSYILTVNLKTLPFFNTVDFLGRKCVLVGAPNKIIGSKIDSPRDSIPAPAVFSNGYYIFGYKHVLTSRDAFSEFTLYQNGLGDFASDAIKKTTAELLGLENNNNNNEAKSDNVKISDQSQSDFTPEQQAMIQEQLIMK